MNFAHCDFYTHSFQSNRESYMFYPSDPTKDDGVFAVRWKQYKAHFIIKGLDKVTWLYAMIRILHLSRRGICGNAYPDEVCRGNFSRKVLDTPLLYDLHSDPGEIYPLNTKGDSEYAEILQKMKTVGITMS